MIKIPTSNGELKMYLQRTENGDACSVYFKDFYIDPAEYYVNPKDYTDRYRGHILFSTPAKYFKPSQLDKAKTEFNFNAIQPVIGSPLVKKDVEKRITEDVRKRVAEFFKAREGKLQLQLLRMEQQGMVLTRYLTELRKKKSEYDKIRKATNKLRRELDQTVETIDKLKTSVS